MKFFIFHHQHKGRQLEKALLSQGWKKSTRVPDVILAHIDWADMVSGEELPAITRMRRAGGIVIVYPHAPSPPWWYDGYVKPQPDTAAVLTIGTAQAEAAAVFINDKPIMPIGWYYNEQKLFKASAQRAKKILFAPIHPVGNLLRPEAVKLNKTIHEALIKYKYENPTAIVMVRHLWSAAAQGLEYNSRLIYKVGKADGSFADIDWADVIIAEGTFMHIAASRGKPVIGFGQDTAVRPNGTKHEISPVHFNDWNPLVRYPIDFSDAQFEELLQAASQGTLATARWREENIGESLDAKQFSDLLMRLYNGR